MARVLVVYHRAPPGVWRSTYGSHLRSFERYSDHECFYLNTARPSAPSYLKTLSPDLVIYHYTCLAERLIPDAFARQLRLFEFTKNFDCPKALVPHDEQARSDILSALVRDLGVTHVFTPASPPQWPQIYHGVDFDAVTFRTVLTGYVDDATVRRVARQARRVTSRSVDIGYRSSFAWPFYGRHGLLKGEIGRVFQERAPEFGISTDISSESQDAILGNRWFDFLLDCKYTIGVEGGSSLLDADGSIAKCTFDYVRVHGDAPFDTVEALCFPGRDGEFDYRILGPRHFEAVMTKTCQVLVEGRYGGVLEPGKHYIELKRDFSNLDEVLGVMKEDTLREGIVERAYHDVIESGRWSYQTFADTVLSECLAGIEASRPTVRSRVLLVRNRASERAFLGVILLSRSAGGLVGLSVLARDYARHVREQVRYTRAIGVSEATQAWHRLREFLSRPFAQQLRDAAVLAVGEERLWRVLVHAHNVVRRVQGRSPRPLQYTPTEAELARRQRRAERQHAKGSE